MDIAGLSLPTGLSRLFNGHRDDDEVAPAGADGDRENDAEADTDKAAVEQNEGTPDDEDDGIITVTGKTGDKQVTVPRGASVAIDVPEGADVDPENVTETLSPELQERVEVISGVSNPGGSTTVSPHVAAQADDEGTTVRPIAAAESDRLGGQFQPSLTEFDFIDSDKIQKLRDNRVDYTDRVGKWILVNDDRVPAILNHQVGLILGQEGLEVEPADPDNEADQRLASHLEAIHEGGDEADVKVKPGNVVRRIMAQNYMAARSVVRSVDLAELPLESLTYYRDPESGEEFYLQDEVAYKKVIFEESEDDGPDSWTTERRESEKRVLRIGEHVFDAHLFNEEPLRSIADLVVNKMVTQRLMARKAEIASVGGLYIKVNPPEWLRESEYDDVMEDPDNEGESVTKLELHMREGVDNAFNTLEDYQSGFIMSIPSHWEVEQIEVPETGEPMAEQIRTYNQAIAARLMFPLDLMELREGAELSRDTLFRTLLNTIAGWRQEVLSVFEDFAAVQKDIHGMGGEVTYSLPALESEDEDLLVSALNFAGLAGLSTREVRQVFNRIEGFDLNIPEEDETEQPPSTETEPGGPQSPEDREQSMRDMLEQTTDGQPAGAFSPGVGQDAFTPPEGLDLHELEGWTQLSVWKAFLSLGGRHTTCSTRMATEVRNADAWCAALKDQALGTDLWRKGSGADPMANGHQLDPETGKGVCENTGEEIEVETMGDLTEDCPYCGRPLSVIQGSVGHAQDPKTFEFGGSIDDFANAVQAVLEDNRDAEISTLNSEDDYVAFSVGGVDPTDDDADADAFDPVIVVDAGEGEYTVQGASSDDLSGLESRLGDAGS